jgi:hypothetical protein
MDYLSRYEQLLKQQQIKFIRHGNLLLRAYGSIIIPLGPVLANEPDESVLLKPIFSQLSGKLVWWSYVKKGFEENEWYAVIKDVYLPIEAYRTANIRNQIRKGLKNCVIKEISPDELLLDGFSIYKKAFSSFQKKIPLSNNAYNQWVNTFKGFSDIINFIGIFVDEKLVGYSLIYLYAKQEANISEIRIDPAYHKFYPSYALFHWLSEKYLVDEKFEYLSDGYRNLVHQTSIQDLLIAKFGFKKKALFLELGIRKPYNVLFSGIISSLWNYIPLASFKAVAKLSRIIDAQQKRLPK